jgi:hypothetical protein
MYARIDVTAYNNGLKTAQNILTYPQGAAGKRFGTWYTAELTDITNADEMYFKTFPYLEECVYLLVFKDDEIDIYLEDQLIHNETSTGIAKDQIDTLDHTVLLERFRIASTISQFKPKDMTRSSDTPNVITSVDTANNEIDLTTSITDGIILPFRFTNTSGALPTTDPQIVIGRTYFLKATSTTSIKVYNTSLDARLDNNAFDIQALGGTNNVVTLNSWSFASPTFRNLPVFDFEGGYDSINFTPAATTGSGVVLTASSAIFSADFVGGIFAGNAGIARIVGYTDTTHVTVDILEDFASTSAISGRISLLAEPAWSDTRGWPSKCSTFQNRSILANTETLPYGIWLSTVNDYDNFNDAFTDADDSIGFIPGSDDINYIKFIVPYRSLTVHSNSGVYSTSVGAESAVTPSNFFLNLQDSTPATDIQPQTIDNQILALSGNDLQSLLWDGLNNTYESNIVSAINEHLIRTPKDSATHKDLSRAGSRYLLIVNEDGTLAMYQTLVTENVSGMTPASLKQLYGNAYFRKVASVDTGRCWFVVEREIAEASSTINITAYSSSTLTAVGSSFSTTDATAIKFAGTALPSSTPALATNTYYWAIGVDADTFKVYASKTDAENDNNSFVFTDFGTSATVEPWDLTTKFFIEELDFDVTTDCSTKFDYSSAVSSISSQTRFNAQKVLIQGDGYGFTDESVVGGNVEIKAHGESVEVSSGHFGFPIDCEIQPMPLSVPTGQAVKTSNVVNPKKIRSVTLMFDDTVGGYVNNIPLAIKSFDEVSIGSAPIPATGIFKLSLMQGWDDFNVNVLTITHEEPFDFKLTGIFYKLEV